VGRFPTHVLRYPSSLGTAQNFILIQVNLNEVVAPPLFYSRVGSLPTFWPQFLGEAPKDYPDNKISPQFQLKALRINKYIYIYLYVFIRIYVYILIKTNDTSLVGPLKKTQFVSAVVYSNPDVDKERVIK
jgi:preprotein translocase subunit SecY